MVFWCGMCASLGSEFGQHPLELELLSYWSLRIAEPQAAMNNICLLIGSKKANNEGGYGHSYRSNAVSKGMSPRS